MKKKKYISCATKRLAIAALICAVILLIGIVLILAEAPNIALQIGFVVLGGFMGILFFACFLAEKSRAVVIDAETIIFPRGADKNGKISLQKTVVRFDEVQSIKSTFRKGDGTTSGDCFFHVLILKDGTKITVALYAYGKDAEKEIVDTIRQKVA